MDAARTIYAYATGPELAELSLIGGRGSYDHHLLLSLAAYPLLEGLVRRKLSAFLTSKGEVVQSFVVPGKSGKRPRAYRKGQYCNSIRDALYQLEECTPHPELRGYLTELRTRSNDCTSANSPSGLGVEGGSRSLYEYIGRARNASLHGELGAVEGGLTALLLGTIIALADLRDNFDEYRRCFVAAVQLLAPTDPYADWGHIQFYPVVIRGQPAHMNVHCWQRLTRTSADDRP